MDTTGDIYNQVATVAGLLHSKGWSERNAGNFSVRVDLDTDIIPKKNFPLKNRYPELANQIFIITGRGKRMRDIAVSPAKNTVVIKIGENGDSYSILSIAEIEPTSELLTHLAIHSMIVQRGSNEKAVVHSHVTELIALTQIPEFCDEEKLNNLLWSMHPETIMFIPEGLGFVPFKIPGSKEIADSTILALNKHSVALWEKHGAFSIGETLDDCFDLLDIAAKSAGIYFICSQAGKYPQGLTENQLNELRKVGL